MSRWLRIALAAQLVFFAVWGMRLLTSHRDVGVIWLATEPVDPRDLLSGHYVALRYRIASAETAHCERATEDPSTITVYVQLAAIGEPVVTAEGPAVISEPVGCQTTVPHAAKGDVWITGQLDPGNGRVVYGIERMFVGEDNPLREARSGSVVAKVAINDGFEPRLVALISKRPTDVPADGVP
jgi:uncharacterized membrane-anchored protein